MEVWKKTTACDTAIVPGAYWLLLLCDTKVLYDINGDINDNINDWYY